MIGEVPLRAGEAVRWTGHPDPSRIFTAADGILIPSAIAFTALGFSLAVNEPESSRGFALALIAQAGEFFLVGRFFAKAHLKRRTRYVITPARAVICRPRKRFYSFELGEKNPHLEVIRSHRHLSLRFTSDSPRSYGRVRYQIFSNTGLDHIMIPGRDIRIAFDDVLRTNELEEIVEDLFASRVVSRGIA